MWESGAVGTFVRASGRSPAAAPARVAGAPAPRRRVGNAATARLVQRQIRYQGGRYTTDKTRPAWRAHVDVPLAAEYNARRGTSHASIDYTKLKLARAHIGAFHEIQTTVAAYLNGGSTDRELEDYVKSFTKFLDSSSDEWSTIDASRRALAMSVAGGSSSAVVADANKLLGALNSLSTNLRAADKYLNSYIQERVDPVFVRTPGGRFSLNDQSREVLSRGAGTWGEVVRTPERGSRVVTSEGAVADVEMTPRTAATLQSYPSVQPQIRSENVRSRLYGPSALAAQAAAPAQAPTPMQVTVPAPPPPQLLHTYADGSTIYAAGQTWVVVSPQAAPLWVLTQRLGTLPNGVDVWQGTYVPWNVTGRVGVSRTWYGAV